jgi:hypothetical protein
MPGMTMVAVGYVAGVVYILIECGNDRNVIPSENHYMSGDTGQSQNPRAPDI